MGVAFGGVEAVALEPQNRAVFLDRDGVLLRPLVEDGKAYAPRTLAEAALVPGAARAVAELKAAGYKVVVVTNQPDVGAGRTPRAVVEAIHRRLRQDLALDAIEVCYHTDADGCTCRKPKPGMLKNAARRYGIDLSQSYMVGDRWRDVDAAKAAGCRALFVDHGYRERLRAAPDRKVGSLAEAVRVILGKSGL